MKVKRFIFSEWTPTLTLLVVTITITILNILFYGSHLRDDYDYEAHAVIHDEPNHGYHVDFEISTYYDTYSMDLVNNTIYCRDANENLHFVDWMDMRAWLANRTRDEAFQVDVILGNYRSVFTDEIHRDTSDEAKVKRRIINTINNLTYPDTIGRDSIIQQDTTVHE